jgi:hypothetical protein
MLSSLVVWVTLVGWAHAENHNPGDQEVAFNIDNPTDTMDFYWEDITKYDSPEEKGKLSAAVDPQDPKYQGFVGRLLFPRAQAGDRRTIRWAKSLADDAMVHKVSAQPLQLGSVLKRLQCRVSTKPPAEMTVDINLSQPLDSEDFGGIEHDPNVKFICEEVDQADKTPYDRRPPTPNRLRSLPRPGPHLPFRQILPPPLAPPHLSLHSPFPSLPTKKAYFNQRIPTRKSPSQRCLPGGLR